MGAEAGKQTRIDAVIAETAWEALCAGDMAAHNEITVRQHPRAGQKDYDAIVMAQVSMRALLPALANVHTPLLCSFHCGLDMAGFVFVFVNHTSV